MLSSSVLKEVFNWNQNKQAENEYHRMMDKKTQFSSKIDQEKKSQKKESTKKHNNTQTASEEIAKTNTNNRSKSSLEELLKQKTSLFNLPYCEPTQPHPFLAKNKTKNFNNNNCDDLSYLQPFKNVNKNINNDNFSKNINQNSRTNDNLELFDFQHDALNEYSNELARHNANKAYYNGYSNKLDRGSFEYQSHAAELLRFLGSLWMTRTLCDLVIKIDNRKYLAHRLSLAMFSRKYREEFQKRDKEEGGVYTITLSYTSHCALEAILKYIYSAEIDINPANADEILSGAKELGVDNLINMAQDYLDSLSIGDVLTYMTNLFDKDGGELVTYELYVYVMTHLTKISRTPEFLRASLNSVIAILNDSNLSVSSELEVFDAALRWINYDKSARESATDEILKCVRFSLMTPEEIHTKIESNHLLKGQKEINNMILKAYKYHSFKCYENSLQNLVHREESRGANLRGSSVPDTFVKSLKELAHIACQLKVERASVANNLAKYNECCGKRDEIVMKHNKTACNSKQYYIVKKNPCGIKLPSHSNVCVKKCNCKNHVQEFNELCEDFRVKSTISEISTRSVLEKPIKQCQSRNYIDKQTSMFDLKCAHCGNHGNRCVELAHSDSSSQ